MAAVRMFAYVLGAIYLLIGILGFLRPFVAGGADGVIVTGIGTLFGIFAVNWFHNLFHLVVGVYGLWAGRAVAASRLFSQVIGWVFLVLAIIGFAVPGVVLLGILPLNPPDNILHLITGLLGLFFGYAPASIAEAPTVPVYEERRRV